MHALSSWHSSIYHSNGQASLLASKRQHCAHHMLENEGKTSRMVVLHKRATMPADDFPNTCTIHEGYRPRVLIVPTLRACVSTSHVPPPAARRTPAQNAECRAGKKSTIGRTAADLAAQHELFAVRGMLDLRQCQQSVTLRTRPLCLRACCLLPLISSHVRACHHIKGSR
jgi:hypothetical protein